MDSLARADPFKENFPAFALHHLRAIGGPGLRLVAGDRVCEGLSGMAVLSTPHPEWGCSYYCSSRAAQGLWLFAALCPQAARKALPCLASRPPGSVDERYCSHSDWNALSVNQAMWRPAHKHLTVCWWMVGPWCQPFHWLPSRHRLLLTQSQDSLGGSVQTQCSRMPEHRFFPFWSKPASCTQPHPILSSRTIHHLGTS